MLIHIDLTSEIPIYVQIKNAVIAAIATNDLVPGQALPSVRQLAYDIGVNMQTVNKAYTMLKQEGYIEIHRRLGATISKQHNPNLDCIDKLERDLQILAAAARSNGMSKKDFVMLCEKAYITASGKNVQNAIKERMTQDDE